MYERIRVREIRDNARDERQNKKEKSKEDLNMIAQECDTPSQEDIL